MEIDKSETKEFELKENDYLKIGIKYGYERLV